MTCQELIDLLTDYIHGELVAERHQRFEIHLSGCKNCVIMVDSYRFTMRLARALPKCEPLPKQVEDRLRKVLEPQLASMMNERRGGGQTDRRE
jgi:anti-sigma factor RsiW